jgi:pimeloyl-ACP methyl ester carboxylesterase
LRGVGPEDPASRPTAAGKSDFAPLSEVKLHYLDWDQAGGTPLVILPGVAGSAHNWSHIAEQLAGDRRVIVLEERGQGESEWSTDYSLDILCRDLGEFADALGLAHFSLLGASLGGRVAYRFAAHNSGRLERLIVIDIPPAQPHPDAELPPAEHPESYEDPQDALEALRRLGSRVDEVFFKDRFGHNYRRREDGRYVHAHDPQLARQTVAEMRAMTTDDHDLLRKIEIPTLLVHGARNPGSLAAMKRVADSIEGATLVDIENAGHAVHLDNPIALVAAMRAFL